MLQAVLDSAQVAADGGNLVNGVTNGGNGSGSTGLVADVNAVDSQGLRVHITDLDLHLVVAVSGVANLQGQGSTGSFVGDLGGTKLNQALPIICGCILRAAAAVQCGLAVLTSQIVLGIVHAAFLLGDGNNTIVEVAADEEVLIVLRGMGQTLGGDIDIVIRNFLEVRQVNNIRDILILAVCTDSEDIGSVANFDSATVLDVSI